MSSLELFHPDHPRIGPLRVTARAASNGDEFLRYTLYPGGTVILPVTAGMCILVEEADRPPQIERGCRMKGSCGGTGPPA